MTPMGIYEELAELSSDGGKALANRRLVVWVHRLQNKPRTFFHFDIALRIFVLSLPITLMRR